MIRWRKRTGDQMQCANTTSGPLLQKEPAISAKARHLCTGGVEPIKKAEKMKEMLVHPASPIIPWIGGKRRLADKLIPLFPPHECYVELFCGGAALYFMRQVPAHVEIINDVNGDLVNLYRVVQNHLEEFVRQFEWALSSRQIFKRYQGVDRGTLTDIQRAARFYYLQHHAFGGKVSGQNFGVSCTKSSFNFTSIKASLSAAHERMAQGTVIENMPWLECFSRYDRPHTFFYADPPYWKTEGYGVPFPWSEYEALASAIKECTGKMMISINDHPDIRDLFSGNFVHDLGIKYSIGSHNGSTPGESRELIITNYEPVAMGGGLF